MIILFGSLFHAPVDDMAAIGAVLALTYLLSLFTVPVMLSLGAMLLL